jgi:hypothetical protein
LLIKYLQIILVTNWKDHTPWSSWFHSRGEQMFHHTQINKHKSAHKPNQEQKSHDHLSRSRKSLWQNSTSFYDKSYKNLGIEETSLSIIKAIYDKQTYISKSIGKILKVFLLKGKRRWGYLVSPLLFNIELEFLSRTIR